MAVLDFMVDPNFRNEKAGRVVVFPGDRRNRGYVVRSEAEEQKIRSFLRMFYFAHMSILFLGIFLSSSWASNFRPAWERPSAFMVLRAAGIFLGIYCLVVGAPYFWLWTSYKKAFLSFTSAQNEVLVSGKSASQHQNFIRAGLIAFVGLILLGAAIFLVTRAK
jgi:hypothetical protein